MASPTSAASPDPAAIVDRWFQALDQRTIRIGVREWLVQVTGIHVEGDDVWIQIADGHHGGSILLRVSSITPIERAVSALARRDYAVAARPVVVCVAANADHSDHSCTGVVVH